MASATHAIFEWPELAGTEALPCFTRADIGPEDDVTLYRRVDDDGKGCTVFKTLTRDGKIVAVNRTPNG